MTPSVRLGIDRTGHGLLVARVNRSEDRLTVERLETLDGATPAGGSLIDGALPVIGVPDPDVIVKSLYLPDISIEDDDSLARFELAMSLLEPESAFMFKVLPTGRKSRYLGLVFRRELLAQLDRAVGVVPQDDSSHAGYQTRAVALGQGYLGFCRKQPGELVCVVDLHDSGASICFIYRETIVGVTHLPPGYGNLAENGAVRRMAVELKTVINFKLMSFAGEGISVPMSALVLTGHAVDERVRAAISELFPSGVIEPGIDPGLLGSGVQVDAPERFLVALGLAVN